MVFFLIKERKYSLKINMHVNTNLLFFFEN